MRIERHGALIVGHAQIVESEDPPEFELTGLAVIEARQGEGIGRDLVALGRAGLPRHRFAEPRYASGIDP